MKHLRLRPREEGQGLTEYALLLSFIGIAVVGITMVLTNATGNVFSNLMCNLQPGGNCPSLAEQLGHAYNSGAGSGGSGSTGGGGSGSSTMTPTPTQTNTPGAGTPTATTGAGTPTPTTAGGSGGTATNTPVPPTLTPTPAMTTGGILREVWTNINGASLSTLTSAIASGGANTCATATSFEAPSDLSDNYGTRMRALLVPSSTGSYTFYTAGDDSVELWLNSSGSSRSGATRIAYHTDWTASREWTKFSTQASSAITLTAGQAYYIEALHKEGGGGDNLAVGWTGPGISTITVIPGVNLSTTGLSCQTGVPTNTPTATLAAGQPTATPTATPPVATGGIRREVWTGVGGSAVSDLTAAIAAGAPSTCTTETSFEAPTNWADNYGTRMRGLLIPPATGSYTFYIAGDDNVELWLNSSGSSSSGATRIAYHNDWTGSREWNKVSTQASSAITLTANQTYYIEARHKEGGGGDHLAVGWTGPGISTITVIPGSSLSASGFSCPGAPTDTPVPPTNTPVPPTNTPTPVPPTNTPTPVPPTATPTPVPPLVIYSDTALASGWNNWSWNTTVNFNSTGQIQSGSSAIRVVYDAGWAALRAQSSTAITGNYNALRFWVRGGTGTAHTIRIVFYDAGSSNQEIATVTAVSGTWTQFTVPFGAYPLANLRGIAWQEDRGSSRSAFFIDQVELVRN